MHDETTSSLERFVRTKSSNFLGRNFNQRGFAIQIAIGTGLMAIGGSLFVSGLLARIPPMEMASLGPFIAGSVNLAVGSVLKRKFGGSTVPSVTLTNEASTMLCALGWRFRPKNNVWNMGEDNWGGYGHYAQYANYGGGGPYIQAAAREQAKSLSDTSIALLERAAFQYNRIESSLEIQGNGSGSLVKVAARARAAADETMAEILHQSFFVAKYPEGQAVVATKIGENIGLLESLANRLEAATLAQPTLIDRLTSRSQIADVLEELRMDQDARAELSTPRDQSVMP